MWTENIEPISRRRAGKPGIFIMPNLIYNQLRVRIPASQKDLLSSSFEGKFSFSRYVPIHNWAGASYAMWGTDEEGAFFDGGDVPEWTHEPFHGGDDVVAVTYFHTDEKIPHEFVANLSAAFPELTMELRCYDETNSNQYVYEAFKGSLYLYSLGKRTLLTQVSPNVENAVRKITSGFVTQFFNPATKQLINQEFTAGDNVAFEDAEGEPVTVSDPSEYYHPFNMEKPDHGS